MKEYLLIVIAVFFSMTFGVVLLLLAMPWIVFVVEKYFNFCLKKQKQKDNKN